MRSSSTARKRSSCGALVAPGLVHVDELADLGQRQPEALAAQRQLQAGAVARRVDAALAVALAARAGPVLVEADRARRDANSRASSLIENSARSRFHGSFRSILADASLDYPFPKSRRRAPRIEVAPGVRWLSMPLPFALDHINLWLLEDERRLDHRRHRHRQRRDARALGKDSSARKQVKRVIVTHYHPDHAGNAAWLCQRFGAELWTTQGEYLTAHAVRASSAGYTTEAVLAVFQQERPRSASAPRGMARARQPLRRAGAGLSALLPPHHRGRRGQIGGHDWRAIIGHGHAPEHLSLYCEALNTVIAGDMLLSTISTNVSVWSIDPEGDPLRLFLDSIARYRELPADVLVLPSHGKPFRGAHERVAQLEAHHQERFAELKRSLAKSRRARANCCRCCSAGRSTRTRPSSPWARR